MEDEKKKKKNKKKKNKQTKTSGDVTRGVGESTDTDQNRVIQENHDNQTSATADVQIDVPKTDVDKDNHFANGTEGLSLVDSPTDENRVIQENLDNQASETADVHTDEPKTDVDMDKHLANGTERSALAEAEKLYWMDREAGLEETIRKVQTDNDTHIQKEASLEETIRKLQKENDVHIQRKAGLEEAITRLQKESDAQMEKGASLEMKLLQPQNEKDSWLQKEAGFEGEINRLISEIASLSLKVVSLEGKIKQLERERVVWIEKENSMEDTIACLNGDSTRLQIQVMELEESRNSLLQENLQLTEIMSGMQSQIQSLEKSIVSSSMSPAATMDASGSEDMNNQMEAANQLVEKLVAENEEFVEKVANELSVEHDLEGVTAELSPPAEFGEKTSASGERMDSPYHIPITDERDVENAKGVVRVADSFSELSEQTPIAGKWIGSREVVSRQNGEEYSYAKSASVNPNSPPDTVDSEEIVQIPLDEKEAEDPRLPPTHDDETTDVSLTDAPLIGAPFRLISFMARYVSGADLVNKR